MPEQVISGRRFCPALAIALAAAAVVGGCASSDPATQIDPVRACIHARSVLYQAAEARDPIVRSNAIEAMAQTLGPEAGAVYKQALSDPNPAVRFAGALAIGDVQYKPALGALMAMAESPETDDRVLVSVVYALYRLGNTRHTSKLAELLFDKDSAIRANTAMVMAKMGEPSATQPLKTLLAEERVPKVRLQLMESLARLGDAANAELLEADAKSIYMDEQLMAIPALADVAPPNAMRVLQSLLSDRPPQVCVAAAGALAKMGPFDERNYQYVLAAVQHPREVMRESFAKVRPVSDMEVKSLQQLAAIALGWMKQESAVAALLPLLKSDNGSIRVAAAMSILRLLPSHRPAASAAVNATAKPAVGPASPARKIRLHSAGGKD